MIEIHNNNNINNNNNSKQPHFFEESRLQRHFVILCRFAATYVSVCRMENEEILNVFFHRIVVTDLIMVSLVSKRSPLIVSVIYYFEIQSYQILSPTRKEVCSMTHDHCCLRLVPPFTHFKMCLERNAVKFFHVNKLSYHSEIDSIPGVNFATILRVAFLKISFRPK